MNRVILAASAAFALAVVSPDAEAKVTNRTGSNWITAVPSTGSSAGLSTAVRAIEIPAANVAEQRRAGRRAVPRGGGRSAGGAGRGGGGGGRAMGGAAGRGAGRGVSAGRPAGRGGEAVRTFPNRPAGGGGRVVAGRGTTRVASGGGRRAVARGGTRVVAPSGRAYGYGGRGRTTVINNRYYGYGRGYGSYYSPGLSIGVGYYSPSYRYGYGYGYPYYGYGYSSYGYGGSYGYGYSGGGTYVEPIYQVDGWLRLKIRPRHADVFVDGYYVGIVDDYDGLLQRLRLTPGNHTIEVAAPGFAPLTFDVRILPDRKIVYEQQLVPLQ